MTDTPSTEGSFWTRPVIVLLSLAPIYLVALVIDRLAVNVPFWDDWVGWLPLWANNDLLELRLGHFWPLHNEHRVLIPQLLNVALGHLTSANMIAPVWAKLGLTTITLYLLTRLYTTNARASGRLWIVVLFSPLLFSLAQWPRWIDGRPLPSTLSILGLVGALLAATGGPCRGRRLAMAITMCAFSSLSFFTGNMTWLVVAAALWFVGYRRARHGVGFLLAASAVLIPFVVEISQGESHVLRASMPPLGDMLEFVLVFLGSTVVAHPRWLADQSPALAMGVVGLVAVGSLSLALHLWVQDGVRKALPWLAIIVWVCLNGVAAGYGRLGLEEGPPMARVYRYTVFGTLFWIAVAALVALLLCEPRRADGRRSIGRALLGRAVPLVVAGILAAGYVQGTYGAVFSPEFGNHVEQLRKGWRCLGQVPVKDGCLLNVMPKEHLQHARALLPLMRERGASFLELRPPEPPGPPGD